MKDFLWFFFVVNVGTAGLNLYAAFRNRKLRQRLTLLCDHDWKPVSVQYNELNHSFVRMVCSHCQGARVLVVAGKHTLADFEPTPTAEEMERAFPDARLGATENS